jgi:hypothetical protein
MKLKGIVYDVGWGQAWGFGNEFISLLRHHQPPQMQGRAGAFLCARKSWRQWTDRRRRVAAVRGITYLASDLAQETYSDFAVPFNRQSRG